MGMMEYQIGWKIGGDGGNGEKCHNSLAASVYTMTGNFFECLPILTLNADFSVVYDYYHKITLIFIPCLLVTIMLSMAVIASLLAEIMRIKVMSIIRNILPAVIKFSHKF